MVEAVEAFQGGFVAEEAGGVEDQEGLPWAHGPDAVESLAFIGGQGFAPLVRIGFEGVVGEVVEGDAQGPGQPEDAVETWAFGLGVQETGDLGIADPRLGGEALLIHAAKQHVPIKLFFQLHSRSLFGSPDHAREIPDWGRGCLGRGERCDGLRFLWKPGVMGECVKGPAESGGWKGGPSGRWGDGFPARGARGCSAGAAEDGTGEVFEEISGWGGGEGFEVGEGLGDVVLGGDPGRVESAGLDESRAEVSAEVGGRIGQEAADGGGLGGGSSREEADQGEGQLLLLEVGAEGFAAGPFVSPEVEDVVGDLEGDAEVTAEGVEMVGGGRIGPGVVGAEAAGDGGQFGGFAFDDGEIGGLVEVEVASVVDLLEFPLADAVGGGADPAAGEGGFERGGEVEGVGEEVVAEEDGGLVSPLGVDGGRVPADDGLVEDVVMHEGGRVDHLDDGGEDGVGWPDAAAGPGREEDEGRSKLLATESGGVVDQLGDEIEPAAQLVSEDGLGLGEVGGDRGIGGPQPAVDFLGREEGRGVEGPGGGPRTGHIHRHRDRMGFGHQRGPDSGDQGRATRRGRSVRGHPAATRKDQGIGPVDPTVGGSSAVRT